MAVNFKQFFLERFYNDTLHPRFWNEANQLDQEVEKKLLQIAKDVSDKAEVTEFVQDVQLTGSLSNYNYTKYSDLDVHILLDFADINEDEDLVKSSLDGKRFIWNDRHNITIGDAEVEIYFQDVDEPHMASGLYSLSKGKWLREPVYDPPEVDGADVDTKADQIKRDIDTLRTKVEGSVKDKEETTELRKVAQYLRQKIARMRKDSLQKHGEFGVGNLAFKELRNSGYIGDLIDIDSKLYDNLFIGD